MQPTPTYLTYMGKGPERMVHWEHWADPDAETYLSGGIDAYDHPRQCRLKINELYPHLNLYVYPTDNPIPRPSKSTAANRERHTTRWGTSETGTWQHGEAFFEDVEDVLAFSPLEKGNFSDWGHVVESRDYSSEEIIYNQYRNWFPAEWGDKAPEGSDASVSFYNTMFMWPLLTFGWENFMCAALDPRFERVMNEFREINRRTFRAFSRLPVNFIICHDDIFTTRGPVCSPEWMKKYIFSAYEEQWGIARAAGKEIIFMADGCADAYADDIMALGARGIISEPYTDYKKLAKKHKDCFIAGEGDNRILSTCDKDLIYKMVKSMVETGNMSGGYMMCIGNHIPWNVPGEGIKYYLDYSAELAYRNR